MESFLSKLPISRRPDVFFGKTFLTYFSSVILFQYHYFRYDCCTFVNPSLPQPLRQKIRKRTKFDHYNWFNKAKTPNKIPEVRYERKKTCYVCITNHSSRKSPDFREETDYMRLSIQRFQFFSPLFFLLFSQISYN